MKKLIYLQGITYRLAILLMTVLFWTSAIFAQTNLPDRTEAPFCLVIPTIENTRVDFSLQSTNVNATISGVIASVEIEQVYENSGEAALDATYVFPMSSNAAVYSMQMTLDDRVIDADIKEKAEAQQIFDEAKDNGQTASLLNQERPNVFQMSLANIQPGQELRIKMSYSEVIVPEKGIYQLVLPNLVGPRFFENLSDFDWAIRTNSEALTETIANTELNINLTINAGMNVTANCTSHTAPFIYEEQTASCSLQTNPGKDFIVDYSLEGNQVETGLLLYEGEEENFFLGMIQPPRLSTQYQSPPREYVFIVDISGSMRGQPLDISKDMMRNLFSALNSNDRFNIIFFAGSSSVYSPNSLPVTPQNVSEAITFVDNIRAGGGTRLLPAMQKALSLDGTDNYSRTFVILTDGFVTVEKQAFQLIRQNLNKANFFAFGIGRNVNRYIIDGIGYIGEGESFIITDFSNAETTATDFKEYIERPALTNIKVQFSGIDVYDVEPLSIPDVFAERPVLIYGKYVRSCGGSLTLTGDLANSKISTTHQFSDYQAKADKNVALPYLWARKKIQLLSDYGLSSNEEAVNIKNEVTQLGLQYNLITEYTSFVAVDDNALTGINETTPTNQGTGGGTTGGAIGAAGPTGGTTGGPAGPVGPGGGSGGPVGPTSPAGASPISSGIPFTPSTAEPIIALTPEKAGCNDENGSCQYRAASSSTLIRGCTDTNAMNYNATAIEDDCSCRYENIKDGSIFNTYTWLRDFVDPNNCEGIRINIYDAGSYNYVLIQNGEETKLYLDNGIFYCHQTPTYSCVDAYGLTTIVETWTCENSPISTEPASDTCDSNAGTFFYDNCGGTSYYFIELANGRIFDPYFADGLDLVPREGQRIHFDYEIKTDVTTPCTISESPITITCFELIDGSIFDEFPWLHTLINQNDCGTASVSLFNLGNYYFVFVETSEGGKLYYQDGTFYCSDGPGRSCLALYNLSTPDQIWECTSNDNTRIIPPLNEISNYMETFVLRPNPAKGSVFIDLPSSPSIYKIKLMDISGKLLKQMNTDEYTSTIEIEVNDLSQGIYLVELKDGSSSRTQKLIVR